MAGTQAKRDENRRRTSGRPHDKETVARAIVELAAERSAISRELATLRSTLLDKPETGIEDGDPVIAERAKNLSLIDGLEGHLTEIERALSTARHGAYGICERCGRPIEAERLHILPETRLCVTCKSQLEKLEHRRGRER